jgi:hypothetical protein
LGREIAAQVECAGIVEISRRPRLNQSFHAITGAKMWRRGGQVGCVRVAVQIQTHAAADRHKPAVHFHIFEIYFVAASPRQGHRIIAKAPLPTQRLSGIQAARSDEPCYMIRRYGGSLDAERHRTDSEPCDESESPCRGQTAPPQKKSGGEQRHDRRRNPQPERSRPPFADFDTCGKRSNDPHQR